MSGYTNEVIGQFTKVFIGQNQILKNIKTN